MKILVTGAGFAGATAARLLAEAGHEVTVIDQRSHIAGNAYDEVDSHGIRVHKYGPHLWHTSNDEVQEWASKFTEWVPYKHIVGALLNDSQIVSLPINQHTIDAVFDEKVDEFMESKVDTEIRYTPESYEMFINTIKVPCANITNSRQLIESQVGKKLCDLFFAPYSLKMWGMPLEELPASVAARIPTNINPFSDLYFPKDKHQYLPKDGYAKMVENILDHSLIKVVLEVKRQEFMRDSEFDHIFTSEPIDEFFHYCYGELRWRSIKMHTVSLPSRYPLFEYPVVNYTDDGKYTRVTEWANLPGHKVIPHSSWTTLTFEEPCDYKDNNFERYYPVKTVDGSSVELYKKYKELSKQLAGVTFIGRAGMYVYIDMHQAISSTMHAVKEFLKK